ncbi:MAG: hypothetical protein GY842_01705 [bacterium]|nr:hypothetical protein [bacterium]
MVSVRGLRLLETALKVTQGLLLVGVVLAARAALSGSSANDPTPVAARPTADEVRAAAAAPPRTLDGYASIWERDLRQPPIPPAPQSQKKPKAKAKPPPPLPALLGTFVEPETSWAHFRTRSGRERILRPGAVIDRYTVVSIEPGRVRLQSGEDYHWVDVPKPKLKGNKKR